MSGSWRSGAARGDVAGVHQDRLLRHARQHARRRRAVEVVGVAAGHLVVPAMEVALEPQQRLLAGEGARQPHRHQRRLGAGRGEAEALGRRAPGAGPRCAHCTSRGCDAPNWRAFIQRLAHRRGHHRVVVAQQQRAVAAEIVDVAVAIDVPLVRALRARDEHAVRIDVARVMGDAAREQLVRLLRQLGRAGRALAIGGDDAGIAQFGGDVVHGPASPIGWRLPYLPRCGRVGERGARRRPHVRSGAEGRAGHRSGAGRGRAAGCGVRRRQGGRDRAGSAGRQADARRVGADRGARADRSAHPRLLGRHVARRRSGRVCEGERAAPR